MVIFGALLLCGAPTIPFRAVSVLLEVISLYNKNTRRLVSVALIVLLSIVFGITTGSFFTYRNIIQLFRQAAFTGLVACGMCFVMVGGGIDLSAGGVIWLVGVVAARASLIPGIPGILVILISMVAGGICGTVNGAIVTKLHLSEFVTTLATGTVFTGLALLTTFRERGRVVSVTLKNRGFIEFGGMLGDIYLITVAWVVITVIMLFVMSRTRFGLHVMAMGSHSNAARMSGVNTSRTKILTFIIGGAFAGLAAAMLVAYQTGTTQSLGLMMEFNAIAACVVGGVVMGGGKGDPLSAFLGALFMQLITNGLLKWGLTTGSTYAMQGVVILLAMNFDGQFNRISLNRLESRGRL